MLIDSADDEHADPALKIEHHKSETSAVLQISTDARGLCDRLLKMGAVCLERAPPGAKRPESGPLCGDPNPPHETVIGYWYVGSLQHFVC